MCNDLVHAHVHWGVCSLAGQMDSPTQRGRKMGFLIVSMYLTVSGACSPCQSVCYIWEFSSYSEHGNFFCHLYLMGLSWWEYNVFWGSTLVLLQCDGVLLGEGVWYVICGHICDG